MTIFRKPSADKRPTSLPPGGGRLASRFRRMNILLFAVAFCIMAAVMTLLLNNVVATISAEYAQQYARSSAEALSAHMSKEIGLVSQISRSGIVTGWLTDEDNEYKKARAVEEIAGIVSELYSYNLYIGFNGSMNQYRVGIDYVEGKVLYINNLDPGEPNDEWYFACINSDRDYVLDIGIDRELNRKRVWIDYKAILDGEPLAVLSTGLEFSHMVGELFAHYDRSNMRSLIIDENGSIHMDSELMNDRDFLFSDFEARIEEEFTNTDFLNAVKSHLDSNVAYSMETIEPTVTRLSSGPYRNVTIAPVRETNWSIVILTGGASLFDISYFIPILITVLVLLSVVALITSTANYRLIFLPLGKLDRSLTRLRETTEGLVYGADRDDELGDLSKTIQDLFAKANIDALTGIYNRRFMENNLEQIMEMLSRSNGALSVLMLDIDFFKRYNDTYGHDQGDICLKAVARSMTSGVMRISDFTARYGGEEFVAVLPSTDEAGARTVADKLLNRVRNLKIPHAGNTAAPFVTVSIGATTGRVAFGQTWKEYIRRADEALYISKQNGRNQFTFMGMQEANAP